MHQADARVIGANAPIVGSETKTQFKDWSTTCRDVDALIKSLTASVETNGQVKTNNKAYVEGYGCVREERPVYH